MKTPPPSPNRTEQATGHKLHGKSPKKSPIARKNRGHEKKATAAEAVPHDDTEVQSKDYCIEADDIKFDMLSEDELNGAFQALTKLHKDNQPNDEDMTFDEKLFYVLCYILPSKDDWRAKWKYYFKGEPTNVTKTEAINDIVDHVRDKQQQAASEKAGEK